MGFWRCFYCHVLHWVWCGQFARWFCYIQQIKRNFYYSWVLFMPESKLIPPAKNKKGCQPDMRGNSIGSSQIGKSFFYENKNKAWLGLIDLFFKLLYHCSVDFLKFKDFPRMFGVNFLKSLIFPVGIFNNYFNF